MAEIDTKIDESKKDAVIEEHGKRKAKEKKNMKITKMIVTPAAAEDDEKRRVRWKDEDEQEKAIEQLRSEEQEAYEQLRSRLRTMDEFIGRKRRYAGEWRN